MCVDSVWLSVDVPCLWNMFLEHSVVWPSIFAYCEHVTGCSCLIGWLANRLTGCLSGAGCLCQLVTWQCQHAVIYSSLFHYIMTMKSLACQAAVNIIYLHIVSRQTFAAFHFAFEWKNSSCSVLKLLLSYIAFNVYVSCVRYASCTR